MSEGTSIGAKIELIITGTAVGAIQGELSPVSPVTQPPSSGVIIPGSLIVKILAVSNWKFLTNSAVGSVSANLPNGPISLTLTDTSTAINFHEISMAELLKALPDFPVDPSRITIVHSGSQILIVVDNNNVPVTPPSPQPSNITKVNITDLDSPFTDISINANECKYYYFVVPPDTVRLMLYAALQSNGTGNTGIILYITSGRLASPLDYDCKSPLITDNYEYSFNWIFYSEIEKTGSFNGGSFSHPVASTCKKENMYLVNEWGVTICATDELKYYFQVQTIQFPPTQIPEETPSFALTIIPLNMTFIIFFMLLLMKFI
jgi:hypothetical protein